MNRTDLQARIRTLTSSHGQPRFLIRVDVPPPSSVPIALVFDLSDSSPSADIFLRRIESLLRPFLRSNPLWIYTLSNDAALDPPSGLTVGQVLDKSVDFARFFSARQLQIRSRRLGSFARPVMEALRRRVGQQRALGACVLLFTDGDLTDVDPIPVPDGVTVVGIMPESMESRNRHWSRVFPDQPIHALGSPALDRAIQPIQSAFWGACSLAIDASTKDIQAATIDVNNARVAPFIQGQARWNFRDGAAFVLVEASINSQFPIAVRLQSHRTNEETQITPEDGDPLLFAPAEAVLNRAATGTFDRIAQVGAGESSPWQMAGHAIVAAAQTRSRVADAGTRELLKGIEATVCAVNSDDGTMEFYALHRSNSATLVWKRSDVVLGCIVSMPLRIWWDSMEARWFTSVGDSSPRELNPTGAQRLSDFVVAEGLDLYFSGDLAND